MDQTRGQGGGPRRGLKQVLRLLPAALVALALLAPAATADTGDIIAPSDPDNPTVDSGWQAGTCKADPAPPGQCSVATPSLFVEQAAGNPPGGLKQYNITTEPGTTVGATRVLEFTTSEGVSVTPPTLTEGA